MSPSPDREPLARVGILLLNSRHRPVHYNAEAIAILAYPNKTHDLPPLDAVLPRSGHSLGKPGLPLEIAFKSGRRRYVCRAFHLEVNGRADSRYQPHLVLVLERESKGRRETTWGERFQLTNRECETVRLLLRGLTSKEIAAEMGISPNTVKSFLKLAMAKVGASNRTALIARILQRAS